jgi:hypothetical protein
MSVPKIDGQAPYSAVKTPVSEMVPSHPLERRNLSGLSTLQRMKVLSKMMRKRAKRRVAASTNAPSVKARNGSSPLSFGVEYEFFAVATYTSLFSATQRLVPRVAQHHC